MVALALVVLTSCKGEERRNSQTPAETIKPRYGEIERVPAEFIGRWSFTREVCEPDSGMVPRKKLPQVFLSIRADRTYDLTVEDFFLPGTFKVHSYVDGTRLKLDGSLLNFDAVDGTLENWSEGDAVYLCGRVFTRD